MERAGLDPSLTFHGLQHVAISTLVDENVHPRVMQSRAGHASSKLTMELYAHVTDDADQDAAAALENRYRPSLPVRTGTWRARGTGRMLRQRLKAQVSATVARRWPQH